mmetsp:Transcript_11486/g.42886  ORF Transcript_11486/g.42886 Transcript_11486/m.42886 type:complete len:397 (+) Transcript_11486:2616-3806(+)
MERHVGHDRRRRHGLSVLQVQVRPIVVPSRDRILPFLLVQLPCFHRADLPRTGELLDISIGLDAEDALLSIGILGDLPHLLIKLLATFLDLLNTGRDHMPLAYPCAPLRDFLVDLKVAGDLSAIYRPLRHEVIPHVALLRLLITSHGAVRLANGAAPRIGVHEGDPAVSVGLNPIGLHHVIKRLRPVRVASHADGIDRGIEDSRIGEHLVCRHDFEDLLHDVRILGHVLRAPSRRPKNLREKRRRRCDAEALHLLEQAHRAFHLALSRASLGRVDVRLNVGIDAFKAHLVEVLPKLLGVLLLVRLGANERFQETVVSVRGLLLGRDLLLHLVQRNAGALQVLRISQSADVCSVRVGVRLHVENSHPAEQLLGDLRVLPREGGQKQCGEAVVINSHA